MFEFACQLFNRVVARGLQHGLQPLRHPRHGRFRPAIQLAAVRLEHGLATPRPFFRRRLKERRDFAALRFQLRDGLLELRNHRFALGDFHADRGAQRPQRALRLRVDLRMRIAQNIDPLLKLLLDLPRGSLAVFRQLFRRPPRGLLDRRFHLLLPARAGLCQVSFEKPAPSHFADGSRGGDLLSQPSCRLIHLRQARLSVRGAQIHLFLPAADFFRGCFRGRFPQLIHDGKNFVLIRPNTSAQAFQFLDRRLYLVLNLLLEIRAPRAFHIRKLGINLQPGLAEPGIQFAGQLGEHGGHARLPLGFHALQGFLLRLFHVRRDGGGHGFFRRILQLRLQCGQQRAGFRSHGVRSALAGRALNLLLGLGDNPRHLPRDLHGRIGFGRQRKHADVVLHGFRPSPLRRGRFFRSPFLSLGNCLQWLRRGGNFQSGYGTGFGEGKPIAGWEGNSPDVSADFQLNADLKQLANRSRALNPCDAPPDRSGLAAGFIVGHFKRDPHIFQNVMFGLVSGAVAINDQSRSSFLKRTSERVHARHGKRNGLHDPRAATLLGFLVRMEVRFRHDCSQRLVLKRNIAALSRREAGKHNFVIVTPRQGDFYSDALEWCKLGPLTPSGIPPKYAGTATLLLAVLRGFERLGALRRQNLL